MLDPIVERIKILLEYTELSPSAFADKIDIQRSSMSHILSGRNKPSLDVTQKILTVFPEINPNWLLTGKGKMKQLNLFGEDEEQVTPSLTTSQPINLKKEVHNFEESPIQTPQSITIPEIKPVTSPIAEHTIPVIKENNVPPIQIPVNTITAKPTSADTLAKVFAEEKPIEKILVFYKDKTFSLYKPE